MKIIGDLFMTFLAYMFWAVGMLVSLPFFSYAWAIPKERRLYYEYKYFGFVTSSLFLGNVAAAYYFPWEMYKWILFLSVVSYLATRSWFTDNDIGYQKDAIWNDPAFNPYAIHGDEAGNIMSYNRHKDLLDL